MKLVYCIQSLEHPGGTERVLTTKANYLAEKLGWDIYIIVTETQHAASYFPLHPSINVICLDLNFKALDQCGVIRKCVAYYRKLRIYKNRLEKLLLELKPDITSSLLAQEADFIGDLRDGSIKIGENHFNKKFRHAFIYADPNASLLQKVIARFRSSQLVSSVKRLDHLVLLTHRDADAWFEIDNKSVIPNALSTIPEQCSSCENKQIIIAGRYSYQKGYDLLLQAWERLMHSHPDWDLVIYGDGVCRADLEMYVESQHLNRVHLERPVTNIYSKFADGGFSVLSSRFEGFGMVVIEAMACGLPVVAFDCDCGPSEIINHQKDGLLIDVNDISKLAKGMATLMDDEELRKRMGIAAQANSHRFEIDIVMAQWITLYNSLCNN